MIHSLLISNHLTLPHRGRLCQEELKMHLPWLLGCCTILCVKAYETVQEAAMLSRDLIESSRTSIGTMATVFPIDHPTLSGQPFAMQEYYASCHENGSLTLLFMPISRHSQNILHSPSHSASISVWTDSPAASRPRVSLIGNVTVFDTETPDEMSIRACYLERHPDAKWWLPDRKDGPHVAYWARFDPQTVYYVGGFGSEHYIGYIPLELYQQALPDRGIAGRLLIQG